MQVRQLLCAALAALSFSPSSPARADGPAAGAAATPAPAAANPVPGAQTGPADLDPPSITHTPVTTAPKGKPLTIRARITDPSGVFQPVAYLRRKGLGTGDYIPIGMIRSRVTQGEYAVEIPPALVSDDLEYYLEAYDNAGNGPARSGSPAEPLALKVDEEPEVMTAPADPATAAPPPRGAPPAISHAAVTQATKGQPIEINARLLGDTGVLGATVLFRHSSKTDYRALPMAGIAGDNFTATVPGQQVTSNLEYYLEAFDRYGNGPGRSGTPDAPYRIQVVEPLPPGPAVVVARTPDSAGSPSRQVSAPFKLNPGRAAGWFFMAGFVGSAIFAGGEALAAYKANDSYTHVFTHEGRDDRALLSKANADSHRARLLGIVAGASLVTSIVLLVVFPKRPDAVLAPGSGGDLAIHF